jgi:hypothetical protein
MVRLIGPRWTEWMVRPWCDYRAAYLNGKVSSGRKERRVKPRPGSMSVALRKMLSHRAAQENLELILASKKTAYWTANFMPNPARQELRILPDLRRL